MSACQSSCCLVFVDMKFHLPLKCLKISNSVESHIHVSGRLNDGFLNKNWPSSQRLLPWLQQAVQGADVIAQPCCTEKEKHHCTNAQNSITHQMHDSTYWLATVCRDSICWDRRSYYWRHSPCIEGAPPIIKGTKEWLWKENYVYLEALSYNLPARWIRTSSRNGIL